MGFQELEKFEGGTAAVVQLCCFFYVYIIDVIQVPGFAAVAHCITNNCLFHNCSFIYLYFAIIIENFLQSIFQKTVGLVKENWKKYANVQLFGQVVNQYYTKLCPVILIIEEMDIEPKSLFVKGKSATLGKLLGKWKAKKQGSPVQVEIYEQGLVQFSGSDNSVKSIEFDFDLKFSFSKETLEIKLERGKDMCGYNLLTDSDVENWREILKGKINQRGFHEQFKPIKKIGKGNFASVYLAQKLEDNTHYAVKAFSKEAAYSEQNGKECLIKEIEVMRCLNHKNTMKLHEVFESENSLYIIFELLAGGQLYDKVKSKYKFKPQQTRTIMHGILKGLREMHSKGLMHRDLKPENLLFRKEGEWDCVIADFGLAQFANIDSYLFVRCGTPGYVAPEVINIKDMKTKYSPICDIYSLGLIFHILLYGKSAFPGTTYNEVLSQNRAANINLNGQEYNKAGYEDALDLLSMMLQKKPTDRVTAQQALNHKYFNGMDIEDPHQQYHGQKIDNTSSASTSEYPNCDSPLLTSANPKRRLDKSLKKDSCVEFHMGKENVVTGKMEEVESLKSNKISINNATSPIRKPKVSQFSAQYKEHR